MDIHRCTQVPSTCGSVLSRKESVCLIEHTSELTGGHLEWKTVFKSMWKSFDTEFRGILQSLERHKDLVEQQTHIAHYQEHQATTVIFHENWAQQIKVEKEKRLVAVQNWLVVGPQAKDDHAEHQRIRDEYPTTAAWIFKHDYVKDWVEADLPESPLLWMHGIPGAGTERHIRLQYVADEE
jgi:hypothetical protein